jgi:hypothetical protein
MSWSQIVQFEPVRSILWSSITNSYTNLGTRTLYPARAICITNDTDGSMYFTNDSVNDKLYLPKNSFKLFDLSTNKGGPDGIWCLQQNTQIMVRYAVAPTEGLVTLELLYGSGD